MPSVVKAGGIVKVFPKTSLFPTACRVVVFSRQPACFGLLEGSGGEILGKMIQKFLRTSQGVYVLGFLSPVLKCWGMKLAAATAGLAPVHVEQAGPWGHQRPGWHQGCVWGVGQHPRAVMLLQEEQGVGLEEGSGRWSWAACLGRLGSCSPAFLGFSSQLSSPLPLLFRGKKICLNLRAARFNFPFASEMP